MADTYPTRVLSEFLAGLQYRDVPPDVVAKAKELLVDWLGSALAGKGARPVLARRQARTAADKRAARRASTRSVLEARA